MEAVGTSADVSTRIGFPLAADVTFFRPVLIAVATYAVIRGAYAVVDFRPVVSDAATYLDWSESPARLDRAHVPGYPAVLWVVRALTGGTLRGDALTLAVTFAAWLAGIVYVWAIWRASRRRRPARLRMLPRKANYAEPCNDAIAVPVVEYDRRARAAHGRRGGPARLRHR